MSQQRRNIARIIHFSLALRAKKKKMLPAETEYDGNFCSSEEESSDEEKDELDVMKARQYV
jgi:hypothetical protein